MTHAPLRLLRAPARAPLLSGSDSDGAVQQAVRLRVALALVLLEHRPPHLAVADWLASLRAIVLERSSGSNHRPAASSRPLAPPPPLQAGPASNGLGAARSASDRKQRAPTKTCVHQKAAQTELFRDDRAEDDELGMADEENGQARLFRAATRSSRNLPRVEFLPEETSQLSLAASTLGPGVAAALDKLLLAPPPSSPGWPSQPGATAAAFDDLTSPLAHLVETLMEAVGELTMLRVGIEGERTELAARFDALGALGVWLIGRIQGPEWIRPQVADVERAAAAGEEYMVTRSKTRGKPAGGAAVAWMANGSNSIALELLSQLATALVPLIPPALLNPIALANLAALFLHLTTASPALLDTTLLPALLSHLLALLRGLVGQLPEGAGDPAEDLEPLVAGLSLAHLVLDNAEATEASPPAPDTASNAPFDARAPTDPTAGALADLVRFLGTHGTDAHLAELALPLTADADDLQQVVSLNGTGDGGAAPICAGRTSVESAVVALIERVWERVDRATGPTASGRGEVPEAS